MVVRLHPSSKNLQYATASINSNFTENSENEQLNSNVIIFYLFLFISLSCTLCFYLRVEKKHNLHTKSGVGTTF